MAALPNKAACLPDSPSPRNPDSPNQHPDIVVLSAVCVHMYDNNNIANVSN